MLLKTSDYLLDTEKLWVHQLVLITKVLVVLLITRKKLIKLIYGTSVRVSNAIQQGQLEGSSYFAAPQMTRIFMSPYQQINNADGTLNTNLSTSIF